MSLSLSYSLNYMYQLFSLSIQIICNICQHLFESKSVLSFWRVLLFLFFIFFIEITSFLRHLKKILFGSQESIKLTLNSPMEKNLSCSFYSLGNLNYNSNLRFYCPWSILEANKVIFYAFSERMYKCCMAQEVLYVLFLTRLLTSIFTKIELIMFFDIFWQNYKLFLIKETRW